MNKTWFFVAVIFIAGCTHALTPDSREILEDITGGGIDFVTVEKISDTQLTITVKHTVFIDRDAPEFNSQVEFARFSTLRYVLYKNTTFINIS